jgi:hypothetical protein
MKKMKSETRIHEVELTKAVTSRQLFPDCSPSLAVCRNCKQLEEIIVCGEHVHGCVRTLKDGPWKEEWHRLPLDMKKCTIPLANHH